MSDSLRFSFPGGALGLISAVLITGMAGYFLIPADFRRSPTLELKAMVGMAPRYEVVYRGCEEENFTPDVKGFAKAFFKGHSHRFSAENDRDAISFATSARPQCEIAALHQIACREDANDVEFCDRRRIR